MTKDLINRITYHLSSGGLFNPELADHLAVRNLLMECREALAQPEQEPVAWADHGVVNWIADKQFKHASLLYTTPPQRKPLTDEEIRKANHHMVDGAYDYSFKQGVKWAEYKHGIKGEA